MPPMLVDFMAGIDALSILSYSATAVCGHGGGGPHGKHVHTHHADYGDHFHNCRNIPGERSKGARHSILSEQECQKHGGEWHPSGY